MTRSKFIFVQLRGGMDGLAALRPDDYSVLKTLRPDLLEGRYLATQAGFSFHPSLAFHHNLFKNGELSFLHACGLPIQDRSHFKSQDLLETGKLDSQARSGWLAELLNLMPRNSEAVAFGSTIPLILKGTKKAFNWSAPIIDDRDEALMNLLAKAYKGDPVLDMIEGQFKRMEYLTNGFDRQSRSRSAFNTIGNMMSHTDGPNVAVINLGNWDTHDHQNKRIAKEFKALDEGLATLHRKLGSVWDETVVVICSEFGRSVHQNGTSGTDHGTGGLLFITGGAVKGGQSLGRWPGLKELFEDRDVMPTTDIRSVFAKVLAEHFGVKSRQIRSIFPELPNEIENLSLFRQRRRLFGFA